MAYGLRLEIKYAIYLVRRSLRSRFYAVTMGYRRETSQPLWATSDHAWMIDPSRSEELGDAGCLRGVFIHETRRYTETRPAFAAIAGQNKRPYLWNPQAWLAGNELDTFAIIRPGLV